LFVFTIGIIAVLFIDDRLEHYVDIGRSFGAAAETSGAPYLELFIARRRGNALPRGDEAPSFVSRCHHAYVAGSNSGTINEKMQTPLARL
jgi:hypothetical protein